MIHIFRKKTRNSHQDKHLIKSNKMIGSNPFINSNLHRGWKRNNWISLIHYSFHFFPSYSLFIIQFCLIFIIPYSSLSSSFSCITVVFKIGQSHPMLLRMNLFCFSRLTNEEGSKLNFKPRKTFRRPLAKFVQAESLFTPEYFRDHSCKTWLDVATHFYI